MMTKIQRMNFISECQGPKDQQRLARASIFLFIAFHARPVCRETEGSALAHPIPGRHGGHPSVYLGWPIGQIAAARGSQPVMDYLYFAAVGSSRLHEPDGFRT